ncbi:hypothetical protein [Falsiroseomonas oryzae]|uniref:hypothetical protein n=1 Tax=Falsiroseomonas oryzae TaxID=2766473 RepID=UPI0022EAEA45|nr:hypothetical protein [Roseomonas sp. MO-31]
MARLTAVSFRSYRGHQIELRDAGRGQCAVIIHPPGGRGSPHQVTPEPEATTLVAQFNQAKALIDAVMGPRPPVMQRGGYSRRDMA